MKKCLKTIKVLILVVAMVFSGIAIFFLPSAIGNNEPVDFSDLELISGETVVAQSDTLALTIDEIGHFGLKNKKTGYLWHSCPSDIEENMKTIGINRMNFQSEIVVDYVYKDTYGNTSSYEKMSIPGIDAVETNAVQVHRTQNGAIVTYDFFSICASVSVEYTVEGNRFSARILGNTVLEGQKFIDKIAKTATKDQREMIQESYIISIWLLPAFGAGKEGDTGFVFVPDGCGAYMNYKPVSFASGNINIPVYGKELTIDKPDTGENSITRPEKAYFPMFAISQNGNALIGVIKEGEALSSVKTYKTSRANAYTGISAQIDYRAVDRTGIGNRSVQGVSYLPGFCDAGIEYRFYDSELSFAGIAQHYRELLVEEGKLEKRDCDPALSLTVAGAMDIDSHHLGIPGKKVTALTTYEEAGKIIDEFQKATGSALAVNYIGWTNNGIGNAKVTNTAQPIGVLGGKKEFDRLLQKTEQTGTALYLDADLLTFKSAGHSLSKLGDSVKTTFDQPYILKKYFYSTFRYEETGIMSVTPQGFARVFDSYGKSLAKVGKNAGVSFNSVSSMLYSNFDSKKYTSRADLLAAYRKKLSDVKREVSAKDAYSYMWQFASRIYEAPAISGRQKIYDGEVPMYQMILHGMLAVTSPAINTSSNRRNVFLRAVETGSELCFTVMWEDSEIVNGTDYDTLYGTTASVVLKTAASMYREYGQLLAALSDSTVSDYTVLTKGINRVTYSNGIKVWVNYTETDYNAEDGITVPANGFCYREKDV